MAPDADVKPSVLLGTLDPILRLGIVRALLDGGVNVIDGAVTADALVERAATSAPNVVVLGAAAGGAGGAELRARLQSAAPGATLVVWMDDAELIEVLAPGAKHAMVRSAPVAERLADELFGGADVEGGSCPTT